MNREEETAVKQTIKQTKQKVGLKPLAPVLMV